MDEGATSTLRARLRSGVHKHVSSVSEGHLSRTIEVARISLIVGIVFLHYGMYPNFRSNPFGGMSVTEHEVATFVNSFLLFFFFSVVPLLSVISGWLFFNFLGDRERQRERELDPSASLSSRIRKRFSSLYLPLVTWNAMYLMALITLHAVAPDHPLFTSLNVDFDTAGLRQYANAVFAVEHYPVAFQFWFVRDLFLTVLLSPVLWVLLRRVPYFGAIALGAAWLCDYNLEIFFRPDVLFFFYVGGLIRAKGFDVKLSRRAINVFFVAYCLFVALRALAPYVFDDSTPLLAAFTRAMRLVGVFACWGLFLRLAASRFGRPLARWGPLAFFLYAAHFPLMAEIKLQLWRLFPAANDFWMVAHYLASVSLTVVIALGTATLLARYVPDIFALLNGGRVPPAPPSSRADARTVSGPRRLRRQSTSCQ
jgi:succinoglycan biosynthesis protein ExoH